MRYYPVFLDLTESPCLVVGGGQVGERKVKTLQACGARVFLISRELTPYLKEESESGRIQLLAPAFKANLLEGMFLVIGATDDMNLNEKIGREARKRKMLCNIVDRPKDCTFILPSLVSRGDLTIAVSTGGKSPALAKKIRQELEGRFTPIYGRYLDLLGRLRTEVQNRQRPQKENQEIFEALVNSPLLSWLEAGTPEPLVDLLNQLLDPPLPRSELAPLIDPMFDPIK